MRTSHHRRDLPAEHLRANIIKIGNRKLENWMTCGFQCSNRFIMFASFTQINKDAVVAIDIRTPKRFQRYRQDSFAILATRLSDDLLNPARKCGQRRIAQDRELVSAFVSCLPNDSSQRQAWVT